MDELLIFQRVNNALERIWNDDRMDVDSVGPLADALGQIGCLPYAEFPCDSFPLDCEFSISGQPAGTFEKPDVDLILKESTASSFGKGEKTVLDQNYRKGKEIPAQNMGLDNKGSYGCFTNTLEEQISTAMFVGKTVKLKFYKLAIYEEGGHFDWHRDTTHSDQHHATLLLALNTSWEGGELKLRRNGVETSVDMHPKTDRGGEDIDLQAVAFYTDTEHKVEPVTKGIRIVLQYDVEVVGEEYDPDDQDQELFETVEWNSKKRKRYQKSLDSVSEDNTNITKVVDIIKARFADGEEEVALAMQYLYRKSSILPGYLKGADAQLYRALVGSFDVTLLPVVLSACTFYGDNASESSCIAVPWNYKAGSDLDSDAEGDEDKSKLSTGLETKSRAKVLHLPMLSAIREISSQDYIEHTGNECQPGEKKYVGAGMFVRQKQVAAEL